MNTIIWKSIEGFAWYEISNTGLIRRVAPGKGAVVGRVLQQIVRGRGRHNGSGKGYLGVALAESNGKYRSLWVHRLLAKAFLPPPDFPKAQVNHKNGVKTDNRLENLEWVSRRENALHAGRLGLLATGERNGQAKLREYEVNEIRQLRGQMSQREIAKAYGVSHVAVCRIHAGKTWAHCKEEAP